MAIRGLFIPTTFDLKTARESLDEIIKQGKKAGTEAGKTTGVEYLKELQSALRTKSAQVKEAVTRGLISKDEAKRIGQQTAREFNEAVTKELDRMRVAGQQGTAEFEKLQRSLRNVSSASRGLRDASDDTDRWSKSLLSVRSVIGGIIAYFSARAVVGFLKDSIAEAEAASREWTLLSSAVQNAGVSFEKVRPSLQRAGDEVERTTRFSGGEFNLALAELLTITNDYTRSVGAMDVVMDLAVAKQMDLGTAAQLVGRAMVGQTSSLSRYGIVVQENADAVEVMRERFRGFAEKDGQSLSGRLARLRNEWDGVKEAIGNAVLATDGGTDGFTDLGDAMRRAKDWIEQNTGALQAWVRAAGTAAVKAGELFRDMAWMFDPAGAQAGQTLAGIDSQKNADKPEFLIRRLSAERQTIVLIQQRLNLRKQELDALQKLRETQREETVGPGEKGKAKEVAELRTELEAAERVAAGLENRLKAALSVGSEPPPKDRPGTEAERRAREKAAADAQKLADERTRLQEKLADQLAKLTASAADEALLQLERFEQEWIAKFGSIDSATQEAFSRIRTSIESGIRVDELGKQLNEFRNVTVDTAEDAGQLASELQDLLQVIATEADRTEEGSTQREQYNKLLKDGADILRKYADAAKKAGDEQAKADKDAADAAKKAADDQKREADERLRGLRDTARTIEENVRGVLQLAEAFGVLDGDAAKALESITQIGTGIARVAGGDLSAIPSLLGGVAQLSGTLFRGGKSEEEAERRKEMRELVQSLHSLRDSIDSMRSEMGPLQSEMQSIIDDVFERLPVAVPRGELPPRRSLGDARDRIRREITRVDEQLPGAQGTDRKDLQRTRAEMEEILRKIDEFVVRMGKQVSDELDEREAAAKGHEFVLARRQMAAKHEAELLDATLAGLDPVIIARMLEVQAMEKETQAAAERRAAEDFGLELLDARARSTGSREDTIAAATARATLEANRQIETYQRLVDQGIITQEAFDEIARILGDDVVQAAEDAAAAFDRMVQSFGQELDVTEMEAAGDDVGVKKANFRNRQLDRRIDWQQALEDGVVTQEQFDKFVAAQDKIFDDFVKGLEEGVGEAVEGAAKTIGPAVGGFGAQEDTVRSVTAISATDAIRIVDLSRSQLAVLSTHTSLLAAIEANTRRDVTAGIQASAQCIMGSMNLTVHNTYHGPVTTTAAFSRQNILQVAHAVNEILGKKTQRESRFG